MAALEYWREYCTYAHIAENYGVHNICLSKQDRFTKSIGRFNCKKVLVKTKESEIEDALNNE